MPKKKMHLNQVTIAGFTLKQRKHIAAYIDGPLCNMIRLNNEKYFTNNILYSTPSKYHLTADLIIIEGSQLKIEAIVDVIKRSLKLANAKPHTLVRLFEVSANGVSEMVLNKRFRNM